MKIGVPYLRMKLKARESKSKTENNEINRIKKKYNLLSFEIKNWYIITSKKKSRNNIIVPVIKYL